ncbi:hypothetical protein J9253_00210 [Thiothrix litoralis]|uniref:O-antigen polymerase n=1 Tax=Thiothrix litoralis TaxID=2891210 RepID=A0ABX7WXS9_9GAMM|nr:hypothetical protein [Thiothrix litoralis]QTR46424.1 hypothetical protein J9253_00210 [Thiothrix litoralis]
MKSNKINIEILWEYFYKIILLIMIASIIEYFLILNGFVSLRTINTSGGYFLSGIFSMMHGLENGDPHYRFYASFMEPGTLAMYLIPMIIYTFLKKRYYSLVIFAFAMYLTDSLGGFISVALAIPLLIYYRSNKKNAFISLILLLLTTALLIFSFKNEFLERYEQKGNSASIREENFTQMINNLPELLSNYPFGIPLSENTEQAMANSLRFGFNFTPGNAYNLGGIFAFIGYITVLLLSLWYATTSLLKRTVSSNIEQIAIISTICLIPFIFQRATVWDSNIFSLLIAPFIISFLSSKKVRR